MHIKYLDSLKVTVESLEYGGGSIFVEFILQQILKQYSFMNHTCKSKKLFPPEPLKNLQSMKIGPNEN